MPVNRREIVDSQRRPREVNERLILANSLKGESFSVERFTAKENGCPRGVAGPMKS